MTIDSLFNTLIKDLSQVPYTSYSYYPTLNTYDKSYKLFEEDNNVIFKCLATGISKDNIDITFDKKSLSVKSLSKENKEDFVSNINKKISLNRSIDVENSFANLDMGILTVTMPISKKDTRKKISFK